MSPPVVCLAVAVLVAVACVRRAEEDPGRISAVESHFTLGKDGAVSSIVDLKSAPDVYYHVALANAPLATSLELACDWSDPSGRVVHQNRWRTQLIDRPLWPTQCHHRLAGATPGPWKVTLSLEGRTLSTNSFEAR